jgi:hypothetical protein
MRVEDSMLAQNYEHRTEKKVAPDSLLPRVWLLGLCL